MSNKVRLLGIEETPSEEKVGSVLSEKKENLTEFPARVERWRIIVKTH
jgi:hypothetical protein